MSFGVVVQSYAMRGCTLEFELVLAVEEEEEDGAESNETTVPRIVLYAEFWNECGLGCCVMKNLQVA